MSESSPRYRWKTLWIKPSEGLEQAAATSAGPFLFGPKSDVVRQPLAAPTRSCAECSGRCYRNQGHSPHSPADPFLSIPRQGPRPTQHAPGRSSTRMQPSRFRSLSHVTSPVGHRRNSYRLSRQYLLPIHLTPRRLASRLIDSKSYLLKGAAPQE